jgi:alkyldihydroxyacetonephosphate synthase
MGGVDLGEGPGRRWYEQRLAEGLRTSRVIESGGFADTMDVSATWDKVMDVYERVRAAVKPLAFVACHLSHAYLEGCSLSFWFAGSAGREEEQERRYDQLWRVALSAALSAGATVSHHHGVGLLKDRELREELGEGRRLLLALKKVWDPDGIMNPGKLSL